MARLRRRYVLAVAVAILLGTTLLMGSRPATATPVLHVRLVTRCFVGVTNTPSPCPTDTWIDERSGVVRELQTVGGFTLDQVFAPRPDGRWRVADRGYYGARPSGRWSLSTWSALLPPYPRTRTALQASMLRLERQPGAHGTMVVRGRRAVIVSASVAMLPWPATGATTLAIDAVEHLPLRVISARGLVTEVYVERRTTADLPAGFLAVPGDGWPDPLTWLGQAVDHLRPLVATR
jgi:hypothetical protein